MPEQEDFIELSAQIMRLGLAPEVASVLLRMAARLDQATEYKAMLADAMNMAEPHRASPGHSGRWRDRHGMHVVRGAIVAPLAWVLQNRAHKVVTTAAAVVIAGASTLTPSVVARSAPQPRPAAVHHHARRRTAPAAPALAVPGPVSRPPHHRDHGRPPRPAPATPSPTQAPSPVASPSPAPSAPAPSPAPAPSASAGACVWVPLLHLCVRLRP